MGALVLVVASLVAFVGCARTKTDVVKTTTVVASASASATATAPIAPPPPVARTVPRASATAPPAPATAPPAPASTAAPARIVLASPASAPAVHRPTPAPTGPQIYSVDATPAIVHAGETVSWDVRTSADIVSVAANVSAYHLPLQRAGEGHFVLNFTIPKNVPGFFHGTYALDVHAQTAAGTGADRSISLVFR